MRCWSWISKKLGAPVDNLEAAGGSIRQIDKPDNRIAWKDACALLGPNPITKRGVCKGTEAQKQKFLDAGVGGAQILDVSVDMETGIVTLNELVAVQDCGLIIDLKTAESQVYGGLIMGITYALFEECVYDAKSGKMLNADMEFYRLAGLKDIGQLKVYDDRCWLRRARRHRAGRTARDLAWGCYRQCRGQCLRRACLTCR